MNGDGRPMWNLLVVEDEPIARIGLRYMLDWGALGIRWKAEASNGFEALEAIEEDDIHIVLTDIRMPGMDGLELARTVKQRQEHIQIVFLSSFEDLPYVKEAVRIGVVDYLHKPTMDEEEIVGTLRKAVDNLERLKPPARENRREEQERLLLRLAEGTDVPAEWEEDWKRCGLDEYSRSGFRLVLFRLEGVQADESKSGQARWASFLSFVREYTAHERGGELVPRGQGELLWVFPEKPGSDRGQGIAADLERLRREVANLLHLHLVYADSGLLRSGADLAGAYSKLAAALAEEASFGGLVRLAVAYVDAHLLEEISLAKTAKEIHVSAGHLSRTFLKETGRHFSEYVTEKKMELAKRLLRETNRKVYEIAAELGYANPHYFSKVFRDATGWTPLDYRNQ